jgi:plastocyanin
MKLVFLNIIAASLLTALAAPTFAELAEYHLVIKNHRFEPASLAVPAGQKIKLVIENQDPTPEEFESHPLNREKIVPANGKTAVFLGPLDPGSYPFFGEFNPKTAIGTITVK